MKSVGELEDAFAWHDGIDFPAEVPADDFHVLPGFYMLSLDEAVATYDTYASDRRWNPGWLPLFANGGGDFYIVDLSEVERGSVRHFRIEESEHPVEFATVSAFFATISAAFNEGLSSSIRTATWRWTTQPSVSWPLASIPASPGGRSRSRSMGGRPMGPCCPCARTRRRLDPGGSAISGASVRSMVTVTMPCSSKAARILQVDVSVEQEWSGEYMVKIHDHTVEVNVLGPGKQFLLLSGIRDAHWEDRRSIRAGTSAGSPVFWCSGNGDATMMIGHDEETWDIAVTMPLAVVDDIVREVTTAIEGTK
jgi:hypothetical protein